jgi:hypothetical protein
MIIFISAGRFGNQIFQYAFLKTIQNRDERIIVLGGFKELKNVFEKIDVINIRYKYKFIKNIIQFILCFFCNINLISLISVNRETINVMSHNYTREAPGFIFKKGFLKIKYVQTGYFQSEQFFKKEYVSNLTIKNSCLEQANFVLNNIPEDTEKIFVHIRRGDYKNYLVYGKGTLLPISYFHNQIQSFIEKKTDSYFVFISDEPDFVETEFSYVQNKLISNHNYTVDFVIMTMCNSAILSPSSFSWWGSYLMKDKNVVYAPNYWLGFNSKLDYHKDSIASYMSVVEID